MGEGRTIIVGAGGFGRELIAWAGDCHQAGSIPPVAGLIDDKIEALAKFSYPVGVLGTIDEFVPLPNDLLLMAIGTPAIKRRIAVALAARGGVFGTMIHPSAIVARSAKIAEGAILCPLSLVSADATIGRCCTINVLSSVGHDASLGDYSTLSAHVDLTGAVTVAPMVLFGTGARILPGVHIGEGATIGAGSTVYRTVSDGHTVFTNPPKTLKMG